jgi:hypothetical protein
MMSYQVVMVGTAESEEITSICEIRSLELILGHIMPCSAYKHEKA